MGRPRAAVTIRISSNVSFRADPSLGGDPTYPSRYFLITYTIWPWLGEWGTGIASAGASFIN